MSAPATVEFIGGPLDGETKELDRTKYEWRIPLANPSASFIEHFVGELQESAWKPTDLRSGTYRRDGRNPRHMVWLGER